MDHMHELNMNEMEIVSGGSRKEIRSRKATVYGGPGKEFSVNGVLSAGTIVNFSGSVSYNENDGHTWYLINSPVYGWVMKSDLGL